MSNLRKRPEPYQPFSTGLVGTRFFTAVMGENRPHAVAARSSDEEPMQVSEPIVEPSAERTERGIKAA